MPRKTPTPTKASESVVSRMLAKILGVPVNDDLATVLTAYYDEGRNEELRLFLEDAGLYPWITNVAQDIMSSRTSALTEHLVSFPTASFIVKDSAFAGNDSLWIAFADTPGGYTQALSALEHRGLTRTLRLPDGDLSHIIAIQLSSCRP